VTVTELLYDKHYLSEIKIIITIIIINANIKVTL